MELQEHLKKMIDFVDAEGAYISRVALFRKRCGGKHPLYGNDEDCGFAAEAFNLIKRYFADHEPGLGESLEDYAKSIEKNLEHEGWSYLHRFWRLRKAWYEGDFALGGAEYDIAGVAKASEWGFSIPMDRVEALIVAIEDRVRSWASCEFVNEAIETATELEAFIASMDAGLVWHYLKSRFSSADSSLGRTYRDIEGDIAWNLPSDYYSVKAETCALGRAIEVIGLL